MKPILFPTLMSLVLTMAASHAQDAEKQTDPVISRELIRQWVQTERMVSEEKSAWQVESQRMQDLLSIYEKELKLLDEELGQAGAAAGMVDEGKEKYEAGLAQYREARQLLQATMARLLPRIQKLVLRFPEPLREASAVDLDLLASANALQQPRDVLKSMIAVLNAAERFNRSITLTEETRTVSEGQKITVEVLYLGLCRAYYAPRSGGNAGIGTPLDGGWAWREVPSIADDIRKTIDVYQKSQQPQLIKLPVQLMSTDLAE